MSDGPVFSVVIPVFNKEPHVKRALNSVLSQTFQDFELIVVCDPSTDNSNVEVAKVLDSRIRVFQRNQPGPGGYAARNLGVEMANSKWVAFLDADDEWMPDHLEKIFQLIDNLRNYQVFSAGWRVIDGQKNLIDNFSLLNSTSSFVTLTLQDYLSHEVQGARPIWTSVVCVDRDLLKRAGGFPEDKISMGGDVDAWIRCVSLAGACIWSNHIGAIYHRDSVNMVSRNSIVDPELHLITAKGLLKKNKSKVIKDLVKIRTNNLIFFAWNNNMRKKSDENFRLSGRLFFSVQPLKVLLYTSFSMLPFQVQIRIHRMVDVFVTKFRNF
jgi:glycosyltransferase involved in cell wall biosynthesis